MIGTLMDGKVISSKPNILLETKIVYSFPQLIGMLFCCSNCTRPDIRYDANDLYKYEIVSWKTYQTTLRVPRRAGHVFSPLLSLGKVEGATVAYTLGVISTFGMNFPTS